MLISFDSKRNVEKLITCHKFKELEYRCQKSQDVYATYDILKRMNICEKLKDTFKEMQCKKIKSYQSKYQSVKIIMGKHWNSVFIANKVVTGVKIVKQICLNI